MLSRFKRSRGDTRQQIKWFMFGGGLTMLGAIVPYTMLLALTGTAVPVAVGIAISRYRLYDIDQIISRTVAYAILTLLLGVLYGSGVSLLGSVLNPIDGDSPLPIAISTLAVAILFQPARRSIQRIVDRHFHRERYNATVTIERFNAELREDLDTEVVRRELLAAIGRTLEPSVLSLWLRPRPMDRDAQALRPSPQPLDPRHHPPFARLAHIATSSVDTTRVSR